MWSDNRAVLQAMSAMNKQMNLPALMNIMREFEKQNERMEMTSDVMGDAIDDAFEVLSLFTGVAHVPVCQLQTGQRSSGTALKQHASEADAQLCAPLCVQCWPSPDLPIGEAEHSSLGRKITPRSV